MRYFVGLITVAVATVAMAIPAAPASASACVKGTHFCYGQAKTYRATYGTCRASGPQLIAGTNSESKAARIFSHDFKADYQYAAEQGCLAGFRARRHHH